MQNNVFWQSLKMLCYLPHGISSTSQKKTKQQNNTPLFCIVITENTAWPQEYSFPPLAALPSAPSGWVSPSGGGCTRGWHREPGPRYSVPQAEPGRHSGTGTLPFPRVPHWPQPHPHKTPRPREVCSRHFPKHQLPCSALESQHAAAPKNRSRHLLL